MTDSHCSSPSPHPSLSKLTLELRQLTQATLRLVLSSLWGDADDTASTDGGVGVIWRCDALLPRGGTKETKRKEKGKRFLCHSMTGAGVYKIPKGTVIE